MLQPKRKDLIVEGREFLVIFNLVDGVENRHVVAVSICQKRLQSNLERSAKIDSFKVAITISPINTYVND